MEDTTQTAAPETSGAAQPDATQSAPQKSANEVKLEGELKQTETKRDTYKKERDAARKDLGTVTKERDELKLENERLEREKAEASQAQASTEADQANTQTTEPSEEEKIKDLLKRNSLKICYMLESGPCFDVAHARHFAGEGFDSLTTISVE